MVNPLSLLLAEIFMCHLENKIMSHPLSKYLLIWYRYVDDIISCWTGTSRQLDIFLNFIKGLHGNIKFTQKVQNEYKINFFDLTSHDINLIQYSIYHKPTHTDYFIDLYSCHPFQHK